MLLLGTLAALAFPLLSTVGSGKPSTALGQSLRTGSRHVILTQNLPEASLVQLTSLVAASEVPALVLLDSPQLSTYTRSFLQAHQPGQVIPVGSFAESRFDLERRLAVRTSPILPWQEKPNETLLEALFPKAETVVLCPIPSRTQERGQLLQAACLAGVLRAPLYLVHEDVCESHPQEQSAELQALRDRLTGWQTRQVYLVGKARTLDVSLPDVDTIPLADEQAVAQAHLKALASKGPIETLVIANPFDNQEDRGGMAALAPWICLRKRAPLLLTGEAGTDVARLVEAAVRQPALRRVESIVIAGNLNAIPVAKRPNPIPTDKDADIEMEPVTPSGTAPFSFAVGRLFHENRAVIPLLLARQQLLARPGKIPPRRILVASNSNGELPLLEMFSRNTIQELRNAGYHTTALFREEVAGPELRRMLPDHDIFLWEGHHNPLIRDWDFPTWDEPLPPSLVFLQSCLALKNHTVQGVLSRGAVGVIGSSTRTYSASGGACSLAFFNALAYDGQSVGGSLRQAKNFLLAYSLLKEKRLGKEAKRTGANLRTAWAFSLWGDPTLMLPTPSSPETARPIIRHEVQGSTIVLDVPAEKHEPVTSWKKDVPTYHVQMPPNARLAGLLHKNPTEDGQPLVPLVFAEVHLPRARAGQVPSLRSRLPSSQWVFLWDERRRSGYLLASPHDLDSRQLRFHIDWTSQPRYSDPEEGLALD